MINSPVQLIELIKTFATAVLIWLVVMGYWVMSDVQQAVTLTMVIAGINLGGAYFQSRLTTPLSDPKDELGRPLSGPNGEPTVAQTRAALKM